MIIKKKRINNPSKYISMLSPGESFYLATPINAINQSKATRVGFTPELMEWETLLPKIIWSNTRYNANGKNKIRRDLPKEIAYRDMERTRRQWAWRNRTVETTSVVTVSYQRYPREFISPPSEELSVVAVNDRKLIVSSILHFDGQSIDQIKHVMNVFLEIFGECEIIKEDLTPYFTAAEIRLNRKILPEGEYPRERLKTHLTPIVNNATKSTRGIIMERIEELNKYKPDLIMTGVNGFYGYVIFDFRSRWITVFESVLYGNATYVFEVDPIEMSQKTKKEIISGNFQKDRIVHTDGRDERIRKIMESSSS